MSKKQKRVIKEYDGYTFDSPLEVEHYKMLKASKEIEIVNMKPSFKLVDAIKYRRIPDFRLCSMSNMVYTPDFELRVPGWDRHIILETKGRITEPYRMRKKLFLSQFSDSYYFFVARNKGELKDFLDKLKEGYYEKKAKRSKKGYSPLKAS